MAEGCEGVVVGVCMSEKRGDPKKTSGAASCNRVWAGG